MPLCPDCLSNDHRLSAMIAQGEEVYKGKTYVILVCIECGSSIRIRKEAKGE